MPGYLFIQASLKSSGISSATFKCGIPAAAVKMLIRAGNVGIQQQSANSKQRLFAYDCDFENINNDCLHIPAVRKFQTEIVCICLPPENSKQKLSVFAGFLFGNRR